MSHAKEQQCVKINWDPDPSECLFSLPLPSATGYLGIGLAKTLGLAYPFHFEHSGMGKFGMPMRRDGPCVSGFLARWGPASVVRQSACLGLLHGCVQMEL